MKTGGPGGEVVRYLTPTSWEFAIELTDAVACCKPGITLLVLTIDGSGQHAIFALQS